MDGFGELGRRGYVGPDYFPDEEPMFRDLPRVVEAALEVCVALVD